MSISDPLGMAISTSAETARQGGFPVGAVIIKDDEIVGIGGSDGKRQHDPTWHAEIDAIRKACAYLQTRNLRGATLYSSMEPCLMCYSACYWANISKIVFAVSKDSIDEMHYEKGASSAEINDNILKHWSVEVVHSRSQEARALKIVRDWEGAMYG